MMEPLEVRFRTHVTGVSGLRNGATAGRMSLRRQRGMKRAAVAVQPE